MVDRQAWLAQRRTGIGSSDAAAVCGLRSFGRGPLDIYLDKLGLLPERDSEPMRWGIKLEDVVAEAFTESTGIALVAGGTMVRHPEYPWMLANPDRLTEERRPVELKTTRFGEGWGPSGTDEVPEDKLLQLAHQMEVLGANKGYLAVLIGGQDFRWYPIERNAALVAWLVAIEQAFWQRVQTRNPPALDWSDPHTPELVAYLFRPRPGVEVALDFAAECAVNRYEELTGEIKFLEAEKACLKGKLIEQMAGAERGLLPSAGRYVSLKEKPATDSRRAYFDFRILKTRGE